MSEAVLISIKPKWCVLIASGEKTVEVRKTRPKLETPFKCYIYETKDAKFEQIGVYRPAAPLYKIFIHHPGNIIGEFVCDGVITDKTCGHDELLNNAACITEEEASQYADGKIVFGWHISNLKIYNVPRGLDEFQRICDHKEDCGSCKRFDAKNYGCIAGITRPPQSWMYVEGM